MKTPLSSAYLGLAIPLLLSACSQSPSPKPEATLPADSPYAGGAAYPWSDRLDAPVADPYAAGRDYPWHSPVISGGLTAQGLATGTNDLSDLPWTSATNSWGPIERNRSNGQQAANDGKPLSISGKYVSGNYVYAKGLGVHADSDVRFALNGQCSSFNAVAGIDDEVGRLGRASFQVIGDGRVLFTSPELTGDDNGVNINVNITGVKELQLKVLKGADNFYDHADWAEARVTCAAIPAKGTPAVSDLVYTSASNGWGPVEIDRSNGEQAQLDGRTLTIGGQSYARGLGVHAPSSLNYDLAANCTTLTTQFGLDDEVGDQGSVIFQVFGDGRKLFDSGVLRGTDGPRGATIDVRLVQNLTLTVTDAGDGKSFDHADWGNAQLVCPAGGINGAFDASFDQDGIAVSTVTTEAGVSSDALQVAVQPDGKVLAAGNIYGANTDSQTVVARYTADGRPDTTFGSAGRMVLNLTPRSTANSLGSEYVTDLVVQADGKILLVAGSVAPDKSSIVRLTRAGTLDLSFGGTGRVDLVQPLIKNLLPLPSGQLLVNGASSIVRLTATGAVDPAFGTGGSLSVDAVKMALQHSGQIVVQANDPAPGAYTYSPSILRRYSADGQADASFGVSGEARFDELKGKYDRYLTSAFVILADDRIIVGHTGVDEIAFVNRTPIVEEDTFLYRLTANGARDAGFGQAGRVQYDLGLSVTDLTLMPQGDLLSYPVRYRIDGSLVGIYPPLTSVFNYGGDFAVQSDGKILQAGRVLRVSGGPLFETDLAVARIRP